MSITRTSVDISAFTSFVTNDMSMSGFSADSIREIITTLCCGYFSLSTPDEVIEYSLINTSPSRDSVMCERVPVYFECFRNILETLPFYRRDVVVRVCFDPHTSTLEIISNEWHEK